MTTTIETPFEVGHYDSDGVWFTLAGTWGADSHELASSGFGPMLGRFESPQGGYIERPMTEQEKQNAFKHLRTRKP